MKYTELINVRLTTEQMADLRLVAAAEHTSMSDIVRDLVIERIEAKKF